MDRNTIIGVALIILILVGTNLIFSPKGDQKPPQATERVAPEADAPAIDATADDTAQAVEPEVPADVQTLERGELVYLENNRVIIGISTRGGRVAYVQLKNYLSYDKAPLVLTDQDRTQMFYQFAVADNVVNTAEMAFEPSVALNKATSQRPAELTMTATVGQGQVVQRYVLDSNTFAVKQTLELNDLEKTIPRRVNYIEMGWRGGITRHEKDSQIQADNTTIHYKTLDKKPDYLSETSDDEENITLSTRWVSFKEQFFCQSVVAQNIPFTNVKLRTETTDGSGNIVKRLHADMTLPYEHRPSAQYEFLHYYGPLHYSTLRRLDLSLERQIPLGWSFFLTSFVNRFIVIPAFNVLSSFLGNFGIIILLLTVFIKLIVSPFTFKSYLSTAKMKILKPQLDKLKEKHGKDAASLQSEQMSLYRSSGVSPFGGCLPMLLQIPILIAMFRFFPASIELRQASFLWADDLSTYDSIMSLPFRIPGYGSHISLFTLLMTVSTIIYTRMNSSLAQQPKELKWVSYMMPVMFMGIFNSYAASLSLYYLYFNLLTFGQQYLFKLMVSDQKLKTQIEANQKKPKVKKKSGWQQRLEDMAKRQQELRQQQPQKGGQRGGRR